MKNCKNRNMNKKSTFRKALMAAVISGCSFFSFGQIILQEGFEGGVFPPTGWTTLDQDGDVTDNWDTVNLTGYSAGNYKGNFIAASKSWVAGTATNPDNWLITPQIAIATANTKLIFNGLSTWGLPNGGSGDFLEVYVSTTGTATTDFTSVFAQNFVTETWEKIEVDLTAYVGQNIYIAFRHHNSTDQEYMAVDDILVATPFEDLELVAMQNLNQYTVFPDNQGSATLDLAVRVANVGLLPVTAYAVKTNIYMDANPTPVQTFTTPGSSMNVGDTVDLTIGSYIASTAGDYTVLNVIELVTDAISSNDTIFDGMTVSTGEYARDLGDLVAISGFPSATGVRGNTFTINSTSVIDSVLFAIDPAVVGVRVIAEITRIDGTANDTVTIGKSLDLVYDQAMIDESALNGGILIRTIPVMNMTGTKLKLDPGTYFVGLRKPDTLASMRLWFASGIATTGGSLTRTIGTPFVDILTTGLAGAVPIVRPFVSLFTGPVISSDDADNTACAGQNITLTSSIASGNVWSTGETTRSIVVSANGSYTVTANGSTSDAVTLTFLTTDAITPVATSPTTCGGVDGSVSVTVTGAGTGTINWTGTTSGTTTLGATPVTGLAAGGYNFTYINENGCTSAPVSVSLNDPGAIVPTISASAATAFCAGGSVDLTSSVTGGNTWSTAETTDVITVNASGFYYVVNSTTPGCVGTSNVIQVTVNALPTVDAGADATVCAGDMIAMAGLGALTYVWDNGVTDGVSFAAAATTTYNVTGTDGNGCVNTDAVTITVNPVPVITFTALPQICVYDAALALTASPAGGVYSGNGVSGTDFNPAGLTAGTYTITYDLTVSGCSASATQTIAVDSCLSVNVLDEQTFVVYPNPSNGNFTVKADNLNQFDVIELRDQLGRVVGSWKITNGIMNIEAKNVAKGTYFLVVKGSNGNMIKQIQVRD